MRIAWLLLLLSWLVACQQSPPTAVGLLPSTAVIPPTATSTIAASPTVTASVPPSSTPTATATATPTATPTPTPTATAVPLLLLTPPLIPRTDPIPQANAVCGLVDTLDFPIDPPDAAQVARGGTDFGVFRQRYDKFHAGEDWGAPAGQPNLGTPVYSIGHGLVTFAHPLGWNRDKGVVIVQHTFVDGRVFYSFYGHLDPETVLLTAGSCIERGMLVGNIGQPRTPPHLHFEIREHMPYTPGPGYWPEDPTTVGWLPPSATIWQERLRASPGVQWVRPFTQQTPQAVGLLEPETYVILEGNALIGLNTANGRVRWRYQLADEQPIDAALLVADTATVYLSHASGQVTAVRLPIADEARTFTTLWQTDATLLGKATLFPLPGGGLVLNVRQYLAALSATGELLWEYELPARPSVWHSSAQTVLLSVPGTPGAIWQVTADGVSAWANLAGYPLPTDAAGWIHAADGVYRVVDGVPLLQWALPTATVAPQRLLLLPDGGVLLAHVDRDGRRLIALDAAGRLRWERSFAELGTADVQLVASHGRVYLVAAQGENGVSQITLFAVDWQTPVLTRLLVTGSRHSQTPLQWTAVAENGLLLLNIGGGQLLGFDPEDALAQLSP